MPDSIDATVYAAIDAARRPGARARGVRAAGPGAGAGGAGDRAPFPSPADWRDVWIYFLLVDRFAHPTAPPRHQPWDGEHGTFQGGNLAGVQAHLDDLADLGVGAIWLSPVLWNPQWDEGAYHGYGIQDFLAVDPRFTSDPEAARSDPSIGVAELRSLVDAAHDRDIHVILDVVLNHTGDLFEYVGHGSRAPFRDQPYDIRWRGPDGAPRADWADHPQPPPPGAGVSPAELRDNRYFRRQGNAFAGGSAEVAGDFESLKELVTDGVVDGRVPVRDTLIAAYQYLIALFDVDGFRIDTLKYVEPDFAKTFGNAMREYALSIGKKNFFTFGEVYDDEDKIARFIGRHTSAPGDVVGVDAALDFPLFYRLPGMAKGMAPPTAVVDVFQHRKRVQQSVVSSHGDASRYFVTFLDNHDQRSRFRYQDPADPARFDPQVTLGLTCLMALQGIPCLYYGTEIGLHGAGGIDWAVREALWGSPDAFRSDHPLALACRALSDLRRDNPALRYGRQYFRPLSGNGTDFGLSPFAGGVLAWSRILNDIEVVVVANTSTSSSWSGEVIVDRHLHGEGSKLEVLYSNARDAVPPEPVRAHGPGTVTVQEVDGGTGRGPLHALPVTLGPMEAQVLGTG